MTLNTIKLLNKDDKVLFQIKDEYLIKNQN